MASSAGRRSARSLARRAVAAPRRAVSEMTALPRAVRTIRSSGVFDADWYRAQLDGEHVEGDLIAHYVRSGAARGLSPNPLFDPRWYERTVKGAGRSVLGPFAHYLGRGAARGDAPHPAFDMRHYSSLAPEANRHRAGALGHYLDVGWRSGLQVNAWFDEQDYRTRHPELDDSRPAILDFLQRAKVRMDAVPDHRDFPRTYGDFDHEAAGAFVRAMTAKAEKQQAQEAPPLVSIVMPTRDRADTLPVAIRSVLAQTYQHWELLIVDDGSVDDTPDVIASFADPRIRASTQAASGVCRARNRALDLATGRYVAYLDSDNAWEPMFLQIMVAFLGSSSHDAAYSALEMEERGKASYRGAPLDRDVLLEGNYIDCNTLVHERDLAARIGGWDESLRRTNDWDFVIRLSAAADVGYAPFIGVRYEHDRKRGDRITVRQPFGYKWKVMAKHRFDWAEIAKAPIDEGLTTIVIGCVGRANGLDECLASIAQNTGDVRTEVIVVDNTRRDADALRLLYVEDRHPGVRVMRPTHETLFAPMTMGHGIAASRGDVVVFLPPAALVMPRWLEPLVEPVRAGEVAAAQGCVVSVDGTVESAGYVMPQDGLPYAAFAGFPEHAEEVAAPGERMGLSGACLAVRREDLVAVAGWDPLYRAVYADLDLTLRLSRARDLPLRYEPEAVVALSAHVAAPHAEIVAQDQQVFIDRWHGHIEADETAMLRPWGLGVAFRRPSSAASSSTDAYEPVLQRVHERDRPRRWAIKIGAPDVSARTRWGDWHFAGALRSELQALGHEVVIDLADAWYRPTAHLDDVVLTLRGNTRYTPNPDHLNLLWLISHPDMVSDDELGRYDHRFAASHTFARKLVSRTGLAVETMLQCTDASRFRPGDVEEGEQVLFVGNSRGKLRPVVGAALAAGLPIGVYGAHWGDRIPKQVLRGSYLPNERLATAYRSAGVVLNDHWEDMRREGFLSNRLFDLTASGATVVSDRVPGLEETFGTVVRTYERPDELAELVREALERKEDEAPARAELSQHVRAEHSFAARARRLHEVVTRSTASPTASIAG